MFCPECGFKTKVADISTNKQQGERYRKRVCVACSHGFYTVEYVIEETPHFREAWRKNRRRHSRNKGDYKND